MIQIKITSKKYQNVFEITDFLIIGRESNCDVILPSEEVSRAHLKISMIDGRIFIEDLNSRNGSRLNNLRIKPETRTRLYVKDFVSIAEFSIRIDEEALNKVEKMIIDSDENPAVAEDQTAFYGSYRKPGNN